MSKKFLVNCTHGNEDLERASVAFIVASASAAMDNETAMFLTASSVDLVTKQGANGQQADGYPPVADLLGSYQENGGQIWVCPVCAKARGITEDDLVTGAEIAGAARTIGFVSEGAQILI
ncbi:MAG: DsrE family protein [Rhodospirillales bacterium]|nr:DsrE family protein [Rhodospirillales bacterium]